ncbi:hypothetical protein ACP4OV_001184 [Aristida adscensionis]
MSSLRQHCKWLLQFGLPITTTSSRMLSSSCCSGPVPAAARVATLLARLRACAHAATTAAMMHAHLLKAAHIQLLPVANHLLSVYAALPLPDDDPSSASAHKLFDDMPLRDHVSWTSLVRASPPPQAILLFTRMLRDAHLRVDGVLIVVVLRACAALRDARLAAALHALALRRGLHADVFVANSLVHCYSQCLLPQPARAVFDSIPDKNIVSWNTMLSGLLHADRCSDALHQLRSLALEPDATTLAVALQLCKKLGGGGGGQYPLRLWCRSLHAVALRRQLLAPSVPLINALLDAYAKCGLLGHALTLFRRMPPRDRNVVTWSTVMAACAHHGRPHQAIACFVAMREAGEWPNSVVMLSLLDACAARAELRASRCAHGVALRSGLARELGVGNALVDMYGKCGDAAASARVFGAMAVKDVVSWNAMIGALGRNGRARDALALLGEMEEEPNGVTMLAALAACAHGGLVEEGVACLERMRRGCSVQHVSCVVDMLARAGEVDGATEIAGEAAPTTAAAWSAVLSGCRRSGEASSKSAAVAARRVVELEPGNPAGYLVGMGTGKEGVRRMRERGVKVSGGYSVVHDAGGQPQRFAAWADGSHPQRDRIYAMLHLLHHHMRQPLSEFFILTHV